jgi:hypothetical protein
MVVNRAAQAAVAAFVMGLSTPLAHASPPADGSRVGFRFGMTGTAVDGRAYDANPGATLAIQYGRCVTDRRREGCLVVGADLGVVHRGPSTSAHLDVLLGYSTQHSSGWMLDVGLGAGVGVLDDRGNLGGIVALDMMAIVNVGAFLDTHAALAVGMFVSSQLLQPDYLDVSFGGHIGYRVGFQ